MDPTLIELIEMGRYADQGWSVTYTQHGWTATLTHSHSTALWEHGEKLRLGPYPTAGDLLTEMRNGGHSLP